jgi:7-carboxy-7-deazaguanine synthase
MIDSSFPVMETFYTVQGEGAYAGFPAFFIRLGGCDVGCVWCDVKDSWDAALHPQKMVHELTQQVREAGARMVVITGGEPAMYDLEPLTTALTSMGVRVHLETSGAHAIRGRFDWITFSPKKFKAPMDESCLQADELKIIVFNKSDLDWAEKFALRVKQGCALYLQAEWDKRDTMYPVIIEYICKHPEWRISVQTHKYIGVD